MEAFIIIIVVIGLIAFICEVISENAVPVMCIMFAIGLMTAGYFIHSMAGILLAFLIVIGITLSIVGLVAIGRHHAWFPFSCIAASIAALARSYYLYQGRGLQYTLLGILGIIIIIKGYALIQKKRAWYPFSCIAASIGLIAAGYLSNSKAGAMYAFCRIMAIIVFVKTTKAIWKAMKQRLADKRSIADIYKAIEEQKMKHENDNMLLTLLQKEEYKCLGRVTEEDWRRIFANYADKEYSGSFDKTLELFALELEDVVFVKSEEWFEPYKQYIAEHPNGSSVRQLLDRVECPYLKITHYTADAELLEKMLDKGTQRLADDMPPIFRTSRVKDGGAEISLYMPTEYLLNKYRKASAAQLPGPAADIAADEIDFDSLPPALA